MPVGDVLQMRVLCYTTDQVSFNIRHYRISAETGGGATMIQIAQALDSILAPQYKFVLSNFARFRGVGFQRIRPLPLQLEGFATANDGPGVNAGDPIPGQIAGLIALRTLLAGRAFRGRVYVPFPSEAHNGEAGQPTSAYTSGLTLLANELIIPRTVLAGAASTTIVPGIFHRVSGTTTDLLIAVTRTEWATQRRRGGLAPSNTLPF